jgi:TPR repeat protein
MMSPWEEFQWNKPWSQNNRLDRSGIERDENQLELLEILSVPQIGTVQPSVPRNDNRIDVLVGKVLPGDGPKAAGAPGVVKAAPSPVNHGRARTNAAGPSGVVPGTVNADNVESIAGWSAKRNIFDVGVSEADDLHRLEESIHRLKNAAATPMPRTAPFPPVLGLAPLGAHEDDSPLLDPDTLFRPRALRRVNAFTAEVAKILLASAIAAPTTYFVASWLRFPDAPSDPAAVFSVARSSDPAVVTAVQRAGLTPAPQASGFQTSAPAAAAPKAAAPQQAASGAVRNSGKAVKTRPTDAYATGGHAEEMIVAMAEPPKASPEPPIAAPAEAASAQPTPALLPVKPALGPDEIAMMVERGRALFDVGDIAAARLFFRRAADAGDSQAAIAMGSTYDPEVLARRSTRGIHGNAEEAQQWYKKAKDMGQHVEMLAQRR